jgi:TolB-like protein/Flp pilus assembly protein TadD
MRLRQFSSYNGAMLEQLRQRNVHRVALAYLAGAWLLIQVVETLTPDILPAIVLRVVVMAAAIGFLPALILAWVFEWTPEGIQREREMPAGAPPPESRRFDRTIIVTLVLAVGYFAVDKFILDPVRDAEKIEAATAEALQDRLASELLEKYAGRSLIVLPFINMSADPEQEYFADGIAEELLNQLAKIEELRVISRSTSWTFKGKEVDVAGIRDRLNVSHILEGSVRKSGNRVRVTAQLIDARSNSHLWSEVYDRTLDDIFAIQDEVSAEVVDQLKLELLAGPPTAEQIDPVAYDLYLRGRYLTHTVGEFDEAVDLLSRAVELAPDYVPAIWELARATSNTTINQEPTEHKATMARVRELVDRLVELAPESSYANGWLYWFANREGDLQAAALYLERAVAGATDSNLYLQQAFAAQFLFRLGRREEAAALVRYVVDRDPTCSICVFMLASIHRQAGKHREAAAELEQLLAWRGPEGVILWNLGVAWLVAGDPAKALAYFERSSVNRDIGRMLALHDLGREAEFAAEFSQLIADPDTHPESVARIAAWTRQNDLAFDYLERTIAIEGTQVIAALKRSGDLYGPIKSDPRWQAFLDRYDTETEESLSRIRFNPKLPAEVVQVLAVQK